MWLVELAVDSPTCHQCAVLHQAVLVCESLCVCIVRCFIWQYAVLHQAVLVCECGWLSWQWSLPWHQCAALHQAVLVCESLCVCIVGCFIWQHAVLHQAVLVCEYGWLSWQWILPCGIKGFSVCVHCQVLHLAVCSFAPSGCLAQA